MMKKTKISLVIVMAMLLLSSCQTISEMVVEDALTAILNGDLKTSSPSGSQTLTKQQVELIKQGKCPTCYGTGKSPDGAVSCVMCKGTGKYIVMETKE